MEEVDVFQQIEEWYDKESTQTQFTTLGTPDGNLPIADYEDETFYS